MDEEENLDVQLPLEAEENIDGGSKSIKTALTESGKKRPESAVTSDANEKKSETDNVSTNGSDAEVSKRKVSPLHYGTGWEASLMVRKTPFDVIYTLSRLISFL